MSSEASTETEVESGEGTEIDLGKLSKNGISGIPDADNQSVLNAASIVHGSKDTCRDQMKDPKTQQVLDDKNDKSKEMMSSETGDKAIVPTERKTISERKLEIENELQVNKNKRKHGKKKPSDGAKKPKQKGLTGKNLTTSHLESITPSTSVSEHVFHFLAQEGIHFNRISQALSEGQTEEKPLWLDNVGLRWYDFERPPRTVVQDINVRISIPLKSLNAEFHCPVCLGYVKRASIVMVCLHRFCAECIEKCLRLGKRECPSCRVHIPSRRSLRPDPNFDSLIQTIFGNVQELEIRQEKEIELLNKSRNMNNAYSESRRRAILQQATQRRKKNNALVRADPSSAAVGSLRKENIACGSIAQPMVPRLPPTSIANLEISQLVGFILRRDPQERAVARLDKEFLRTNSNVNIRILKVFLSRKLSHGTSDNFQLIAYLESKPITLQDNMTIGEVQEHFWDISDEDLTIHYRTITKIVHCDQPFGFSARTAAI